mmetsp:Transcript_23921/g.55814  ORF Transcript_23921/g.55814 Transcript_23921/m.55814 type:complete len:222 (+) Transcript_23921:665-1330(+)
MQPVVRDTPSAKGQGQATELVSVMITYFKAFLCSRHFHFLFFNFRKLLVIVCYVKPFFLGLLVARTFTRGMVIPRPPTVLSIIGRRRRGFGVVLVPPVPNLILEMMIMVASVMMMIRTIGAISTAKGIRVTKARGGFLTTIKVRCRHRSDKWRLLSLMMVVRSKPIMMVVVGSPGMVMVTAVMVVFWKPFFTGRIVMMAVVSHLVMVLVMMVAIIKDQPKH